MAKKARKKNGKKKIAIRSCAGCFCKYDRRKIISDLSEAFADSCEFAFSYKLAEDKNYDAALLISGCDSHCAERSETIKNIEIDHNNWEKAEEIFAAGIGELS